MRDTPHRLSRTPDDLSEAIHGRSEAALVRRPDWNAWAAKEIVCHLRDSEELFLLRLEMIAALDEPVIPAAGLGDRGLNLTADGRAAAPERWARDRQYLRHDAAAALATFRERRGDVVAHLTGLTPDQWARGGLHTRRGRITVADIATDMLAHDDDHLTQLRRALSGEP